MFVAELEDGIAGYVKLGQLFPLESARHVLEIKALAVPPPIAAAASAAR